MVVQGRIGHHSWLQEVGWLLKNATSTHTHTLHHTIGDLSDGASHSFGVTSDYLVRTSEYLVVTIDYLVVTCDCLVVTRYIVVMTSRYLVGTRESLVLTCHSLVVTRYYLVRRCAFL